MKLFSLIGKAKVLICMRYSGVDISWQISLTVNPYLYPIFNAIKKRPQNPMWKVLKYPLCYRLLLLILNQENLSEILRFWNNFNTFNKKNTKTYFFIFQLLSFRVLYKNFCQLYVNFVIPLCVFPLTFLWLF